MTKLSDEWCTPDWLFEELTREFNFDIDLCTNDENGKCGINITEYFDFTPYEDSSCFMNPPYSNPKPFIEKAWEDSKHCKIVCLVPNTIKTTKYMDILDKNRGLTTFRKWKKGLEIRDLSRRTGFVHPEKQSSSPSFGCMIIIMDRRGL